MERVQDAFVWSSFRLMLVCGLFAVTRFEDPFRGPTYASASLIFLAVFLAAAFGPGLVHRTWISFTTTQES